MLIDAEIMARNQLQDGGRPPSWICYIIISDHPRSLFIGPHRPVKFYANPMHSFEDMTIWIFFRFSLKCLFTPTKFWFWGSEPVNVIGHHRDPKRHLLGGKRTYIPILVEIGRCDLCVSRRNQKKEKKGKERNLQWQTGCSPRPPTLTQRYVVLHAGWSSGGSSKFQISSKSVERFSRFGGSKFAISYT